MCNIIFTLGGFTYGFGCRRVKWYLPFPVDNSYNTTTYAYLDTSGKPTLVLEKYNVVDEYGQTAGIVTMEDILEEIVGNILDEYDEEEEQIVTDADGSYIIEGQADLEDVEAKLGIEFECEDIDTLSGFMIYKLGKIPDDGENFEVEYKGYIFRTLDVRGRMILKVKVEKTSQEQHA